MKTIYLNFDHRPMEQPTRYTVTLDTPACMIVRTKGTPRWPSEEMTLTKQADGTLRNEHGCGFVVVKLDRRPKPYKVRYDGMDGSAERKFATLADVQAYVKGRWQGVEYIPGLGDFHNDYGYFTLTGCSLDDLGTRDGWDWTWTNLGGAQ